MLTAAAVSKGFGGLQVLSGADLAVGPRSRIGLVGRNGAGKSTLLRILAGLETPDEGSVRRAPPGLRVGFLPQEPDGLPGETLLGYLARRTGVAAAEREMDALAARLGEDPALAGAYSEALDRYLALGGADLGPRAQALLADVGLPADRLTVEVGALSGGQAARAALAAILLARFEVFLLDEPTNNLDFAGLERLERFLDGLDGAVVVVSHDRAFLDRVVDRVVEITEPDGRTAEYAGGWSDFVAQKAQGRDRQRLAHDKAMSERERLVARAQAQREWADKGVRAERRRPRDNDRAGRGARIERTEKQASKVRATERAIERLEMVDKPWEGWELRMDLGAAGPGSEVVARLEGAVVERGTFRLGPVDLEIGRGERVGLLGPNGSGKTTLLRALLGEIPLAAGRARLGPGVVVGELDQARGLLDGPGTVVEVFSAATGLLPQASRSLLAKFGLAADHVERPAGALSPGERTRATLAALMARGTNLLVLDEPTNHLDLEAIEQLEQAVERYPGALVLVTHDRRMLERVSLTRTIAL